jgi:hypothetical protein
MPLASLHAPFDHPEWIFELKYEGFGALGYIETRGNAGWYRAGEQRIRASRSFAPPSDRRWLLYYDQPFVVLREATFEE